MTEEEEKAAIVKQIHMTRARLETMSEFTDRLLPGQTWRLHLAAQKVRGLSLGLEDFLEQLQLVVLEEYRQEEDSDHRLDRYFDADLLDAP